MPHLALIYKDGRVVDMSLNESISPSRNELLQLPKDEAYLGFADQFGSLHLISSSVTRPITKVDSDFGHQTVPNSIAKKEEAIKEWDPDAVPPRFTQGMQVGNKFMVWGKTDSGNLRQILSTYFYLRFCFLGLYGMTLSNDETYIWYTQKEKWRRGPILQYDMKGPWSCASVNASSAIMIFHPGPLRSYLYDFDNERMIEYPLLDPAQIILGAPYMSLNMISLTTVVSKTSRM